jgi:hypothetical protein
MSEEQTHELGLDEQHAGLSRLGRARLTITDDLGFDTLPYSLFAGRVVDEQFPHTAAMSWTTERSTIDEALPYALATSRGIQLSTGLLDLEPVVRSSCLAYIYLRQGMLFARTAARELPVLADAETWLRGCFPLLQPTEDQRVPITFWSLGGHGAHASARTIAVPDWSDIEGNYPSGVREQLGSLVTGFRPAAGGQLVLWHGGPGTGKTHALRALAWEWRLWCSVHYATDPEQFFGRSSYMLEVLLQEDDEGLEAEDDARWRLLVLEDTGELLAADAKEQTGQGLSRLLNVVDGIIGQGLRVLVLVTTNETLRRLHPAVARPGRCAAAIEFRAFPRDEAAEWLRTHEVDGEAPESPTLAELFGQASGLQPSGRLPVGFA